MAQVKLFMIIKISMKESLKTIRSMENVSLQFTLNLGNKMDGFRDNLKKIEKFVKNQSIVRGFDF